jgi:exopolysaccharide biosynthesis predicted pyruvyltransferase EpsI
MELDEDAWARVGARCVALGLSGRNVEAICGNIRAHVQDFEYPDAYFTASASERAALIRTLSRRVKEEDVLRFVEEWASWKQEASERAEEERFEREVSTLVRRLNASKIASALMGAGGEREGEERR